MKKKPLDRKIRDYIVAHYADEPNKKIAEAVGISYWTVYIVAKELGLKKNNAYLVRKSLKRVCESRELRFVRAASGGFCAMSGNTLIHRMEI